MMTKVVFIERNGQSKIVDAEDGKSMMRTAQAAHLDMEGACEGGMACATCHVIVADDWYDKLPKPTEHEEDMLDMTYGVTKHSRLSCQIIVNPALEGLTVSLPQTTRNMQD
jgi:2Fe-2S ferredoxin